MKKRYILVEFLIVFLLLVLPPLFVTKGHGLSQGGTFSPAVAFQLLIAVALYLQLAYLKKKEGGTSDTALPKNAVFIKSLFWFSITLGCLMLVFALMQAISLIVDKEALADPFMPDTDSVFAWLFIIFTVATGAFYEEVIYRQFIPDFLQKLVDSEKRKRLCFYGRELFALAVFAFAHRYLGWIPVLNSFICGIILRLCCRRTGSVVTGATAHFVYNTTLVAFYALS
ncbi:MAG: CPBP family intramembrane metalloprotease [Treponema sp.]|nr:CPBP family intramembrane metalloprotease [Candidatus Treponema equi]